MIDINEIGKKIIVERERLSTDNELRNDVRLLQDAYAALRDMPDYQCPVDIPLLNTQEIDRLTDQRVSRVEADETLLPSEREEKKKRYKALHRLVVTQLNIIKKVLEKWSEAQFTYDPTICNIVPTRDLESLVNDRCERDVPPMAKQHGRLILNVFSAIDKLREFEKEQGIKKIRLENLKNLSTDSFAESWADGSVFQAVYDLSDPFLAKVMRNRKYVEQQYL